jgi:hypothetical protein
MMIGKRGKRQKDYKSLNLNETNFEEHKLSRKYFRT